MCGTPRPRCRRPAEARTPHRPARPGIRTRSRSSRRWERGSEEVREAGAVRRAWPQSKCRVQDAARVVEAPTANGSGPAGGEAVPFRGVRAVPSGASFLGGRVGFTTSFSSRRARRSVLPCSTQARGRGARRPGPARNVDHFGGTDVDVRASKGHRTNAHTVVGGVIGPTPAAPQSTAATRS